MTGILELYGDALQLYADNLVLYDGLPPATPSGAGGWLRRRRR